MANVAAIDAAIPFARLRSSRAETCLPATVIGMAKRRFAAVRRMGEVHNKKRDHPCASRRAT